MAQLGKVGIAGIVAAAISFVVAQQLVRGLFSRASDAETRSQAFLQKVADATKKKLPMRVDAETEWETTTAREGVLEYDYRLPNLAVVDLDVPGLIKTLRPGVVNGACSAPETRDNLLKKGVTLRYSYVDKARALVTSFDVAPQDCGF